MYKRSRNKRYRRLSKRPKSRRKRGGATITYTTTGPPDNVLASQLISAYQTNLMSNIMKS